jgi:hypothetical protein
MMLDSPDFWGTYLTDDTQWHKETLYELLIMGGGLNQTNRGKFRYNSSAQSSLVEVNSVTCNGDNAARDEVGLIQLRGFSIMVSTVT